MDDGVCDCIEHGDLVQAVLLIQIQVHPEVVRWFRKKGHDYGAHMNAVLRSYMESCKAARAK
jgi:uncharacterized protein (DUF4415 family)